MKRTHLLITLAAISITAMRLASGQATATDSQAPVGEAPAAQNQTPPEQNVKLSIPAPSKMPAIVEAAARNVARTIVKRKTEGGNPKEVFGTASNKIALFALAAAADPDKANGVDYAAQYIAMGESRRTDKQVAASSKTAGSTNAADKPGIPYLLGLAIDHGAITKNVSGSTLNLSSSPYALIASVKGDTAQTYQQYSGFTRLGLTAAFNIQNQNDPLASVQRKHLAEWSAKVRLLSDHSPRSKEAYDEFVKLVLPALQEKANTLARALSVILGATKTRAELSESFSSKANDAINQYLDSTAYNSTEAEQKITDIIVAAVRDNIYSQWDTVGLTTGEQGRLSAFLTSYKAATDAYVKSAKALDSVLNDLANKSSLTLAYLQERSSGTPDYSVAKLLYEKKPQGFMQIDLNGSASFYNSPNKSKNEQTFRDATIALGLEQKMGNSPFLTNSLDQNPITLSFSGSYERLQENRHISGKKADIAVANVKLEIPVASGVSLPLSITYSNATELIKEKDVRGNFGITFDLDKLKALATAQ